MKERETKSICKHLGQQQQTVYYQEKGQFVIKRSSEDFEKTLKETLSLIRYGLQELSTSVNKFSTLYE